jgi:uncharacterized tellurite resistance protein B-like protein
MIIIGTMGIPFTRQKGTFYCPHCREETPYRDRQVRRFLTVYFIPLIPLDKMEEYVECRRCRGRFEREMLSYNAEQAANNFRGYVRFTMALVAVADGSVSEEERETYRELLRRLYGVMPTREEAARDLEGAENSQPSVSWYLRTINKHLNREEKRTLVQYAFLMASAGGSISDERNSNLALFPSALGLSADDFKQFISDVVATG